MERAIRDLRDACTLKRDVDSAGSPLRDPGPATVLAAHQTSVNKISRASPEEECEEPNELSTRLITG